MPTLRIEADFVVTSTGFVSNYEFSSYEAAVSYATASPLTAVGGAQPIDFVKYDPVADVYSVVSIGREFRTNDWYAQIITDLFNEDVGPAPKITITPSHSISPSGSYVSEIPLPDNVYAAIRTCDHVFYMKSGGSGIENHGITSGTNPVTGEPVYMLAYGWYSATNSNMRAFISGHGLIFDSSAPDPDPYDWWPQQHAAALVWNAPPDIFWTNRVLCEETPS